MKRCPRAASRRAITARSWVLALATCASCLATFYPQVVTAEPSAAPAPHGVTAVDSIGIPVQDLDRSLAFYTKVLDFKVAADREVDGDAYEHLLGVFGVRLRAVRLSLGEEHVELMQMLTPRGRPLPADLRSNDLAFEHIAIIVSDMDQAYGELRRHRVALASSGPQVLPAWNTNAAGIAACYFRDPDGNFLEILHFPPGKGATKWQSKAALFLGIDHTAIVVRDTAASLAYYRDLLGLAVAGESENSGTEQEHLNNVFGARLRITSLRAAHGPGIELLEYLAPRTGRAIPEDSVASDAWYWQVNLLAPGVDNLYGLARSARARMVSSGVVPLTAHELGFDRGLVLRDPDGHADALVSIR